ncbi:MAG: YkgJ family cysteine cluster protein [Paraclostridium sp.]
MTTLKKHDIQQSIEYANKNNLIDDLNNIYESVPSGDCKGCGNCCMESVGISLVEFLNIYEYLSKNSELRKICIDKVIDYYFNEYIKKSPCPFKDKDNRCMIYPVRPLNCRIYGHWTKDDYNKNLDSVGDRNKEYSEIIKSEYGFDISKEVVNYQITYCEEFKPNNRYLQKSERLEFSDSIMILDSKLYSKGILDIEFKDRGIVEYFIESILYDDLAYKIKIKVSKDDTIRDRAINRLKRILA